MRATGCFAPMLTCYIKRMAATLLPKIRNLRDTVIAASLAAVAFIILSIQVAQLEKCQKLLTVSLILNAQFRACNSMRQV